MCVFAQWAIIAFHSIEWLQPNPYSRFEDANVLHQLIFSCLRYVDEAVQFPLFRRRCYKGERPGGYQITKKVAAGSSYPGSSVLQSYI